MKNDNIPSVRPGYACINLLMKKSFRTYRLSAVENRDKNKITDVIWHNIRLFREIIEHNIAQHIYVYRVSSDLVPFCTAPYVKALYEEVVLSNEEMQGHFLEIKQLRDVYNLRISIHPSQFNVLSSPKTDVVKRSIEEINTQTEWIRAVSGQNVVIHMGGAYGNKPEAIERFKINLCYVDHSLISIENDDKTYTAYDVCSLCELLKIKWVYDFHHNRCHPSHERDIGALIKAYPPDKYHLSSGKPYDRSVSHADYIKKEDYIQFLELLAACSIKQADVIFEAKQKNLAVLNLLTHEQDGFWILDQ